MQRHRSPKTKRARGYVLFIVLIIGVAAGLAAVALVNSSGGARVAAMHTDDTNIASAIAEAGMNHALAYVEGASSTSVDFDALLDVGLNKDCSSDFDPDADDNVPDISVTVDGVAADTVTPASLNGQSFRRIPFNGGAYLIRFDDDDDDGVHYRNWADITGNNRITDAGSVDCVEGSRDVDTTTGSGPHAAGVENRLRDRNRSIWITVVGVYPGTDADNANHRVVMRSLFTGPRPPSLAGIQVKGDFDPGGSNDFILCSPIGSIDIDGKAKSGGGAVCASGNSNSNKWDSDWKHCAVEGWCEPGSGKVPSPWSTGLSAAPGRLDTPGPELPDMPDIWDDADEWFDFSRPCVFWIDNGNPDKKGPSGKSYNSGIEHSLWFWDAHRRGGPSSTLCANYENNGKTRVFPGPPDPGLSGSGWEGCWTPLLLDATTIDNVAIPPLFQAARASGTNAVVPQRDDFRWEGGKAVKGQDGMDDGGCWSVPWYDPVGAPADTTVTPNRPAVPVGYFYERKPFSSATVSAKGANCEWFPHNRPGVYETCDDGTTLGYPPALPTDPFSGTATPQCGPLGKRPVNVAVGALTNAAVEPRYDGLNAKLRMLGLNAFPHGTKLNKPNWEKECKITYPTPYFATGTPQDYRCDYDQGCHPFNGDFDYASAPASLKTPPGGSPLKFESASVKMIFPIMDDAQDVKSAPAGVYYISKGFDLSGKASGWTAPTPWSLGDPNPLVSLRNYPLMTLASHKKMDLQMKSYFLGFGQVSPLGELGKGCTPGGTDALPSGCSSLPVLDPQPRWARWPSWITGDKLTLQGSANNTFAGSIYADKGVEYKGTTKFFVYGELYTSKSIKTSGGADFYWLYHVPVADPGALNYGGALPTVAPSAQ